LLKRKLSRLVGRWFIYISVVSLTGSSSHLFDHLSTFKPWLTIKHALVHLFLP